MRLALTVAVPTLCVLALSCSAAEPTAEGFSRGLPTDPSFFPIGVWVQSPSNAAKYKAAGINLYIGLWQGPTKEQLDALEAVGMKVICDQNTVGLAYQGNCIVAWMHGDEPDNAQSRPEGGYGPPIRPQKIIDDYHAMRAKDPTRPVLLNLGQTVANDQSPNRGSGADPNDYLGYVKGCDIVSFDVYPVTGIRKPDGENYLWYVPKGIDRLRQWSEDKIPTWAVIECTHISSPRIATPHQVKAMVWMALVHGARGYLYFCHQFQPTFIEAAPLQDPAMLAAITAINKQVTELAPVLNSPTVENGATVTTAADNVPVDVMVKRYDGATYVLAVGMRNGATKATFQVAGLPAGATAEVIGEAAIRSDTVVTDAASTTSTSVGLRTIAVKNGRFEDEFRPYDVHLYRIR